MKSNYLLGVFLFLNLAIQAQVGIGTTNPDSSSALDIESTTGGVLVPRMTSAERIAIISPAVGLLVYDTDLKKQFIYNGSEWELQGTREARNNYKLIKSVGDLASELSAGGGSKYLLDPSTLYEINGTIVVDFPIELNGAYLKGEDSVEDRLFNASGGALFTGTTGGNLLRVTILGNGQPVFSINGTGSEDLLCISFNVVGASSVGALTNMGLVFFNTGQFLTNTTGLTVTNINSFFANLMLWNADNNGTFLKLNGNFNNLQVVNGRVVVDSGEIGIDVSSNPTISLNASMNGVELTGAGTRVKGYTSGSYPEYNFTNNWEVDCPGIPTETNDTAAGNFHNTNSLASGFVQTISNNTAVEVQGTGTFATDNLFRFSTTAGEGNNRLTYEGIDMRTFQVNASLSIRVTNAAGNFYAFVIAKNGSIVTESNAVVYITSDTQIQNVAINCVISLSKDDYIELHVQRLTGSGNDTLSVFSENLSVK
jgi:hypothetical protein